MRRPSKAMWETVLALAFMALVLIVMFAGNGPSGRGVLASGF